MTLSEILLWQELKQGRVGYKFNRQTPIDNFIVDFYSKYLTLAIEIDGDSHNHDDQPEKDQIRQDRLESMGVRFLRFDDIDVKKNMNWVMNEIVDWIKANEPTPRPSKEGS